MVFCEDIKEGSFVDGLKQDPKCQIIDWSRGVVYKASDKFVWVRWLGDDTKRKIVRYSYDLAKFKERATDEAWLWRFELKENDLIDCPDDRIWYNSTVISKTENGEQDGVQNIEYKIGIIKKNLNVFFFKLGFRYYDPNGSLVDTKNDQKFFGWTSQYDEDLSATNTRIQK